MQQVYVQNMEVIPANYFCTNQDLVIYIPESIKGIGDSAFYTSQFDLKVKYVVYYTGTIEQWKALPKGKASSFGGYQSWVVRNSSPVEVRCEDGIYFDDDNVNKKNPLFK